MTRGLEGDGAPCFCCGEPCSNIAASPSKWAVGLGRIDAPAGVVQWHHAGCVEQRLEELIELKKYICEAVLAGDIKVLTQRINGTSIVLEDDSLQPLTQEDLDDHAGHQVLLSVKDGVPILVCTTCPKDLGTITLEIE